MGEDPARHDAAVVDGLRVLAVDDEAPALSELTYQLSRSPGVGEVLSAGSAADALDQLQSGDFDAVFLDIRMPGLDGLALARILGRFAQAPAVVFVTAYDSHAVDAFDIAATDYVLKPIRPERLEQALARIHRAREVAADVSATGQAAADQGEGGVGPLDETIAVELGGVTRYVQRSDIVYVEAQRDYVRLHTREAGHLVRIPLATLEERWSGVGFLRVHRRFLVNSTFVQGLRSSAGHVSVDLGESQTVPVSRRFTSVVKEALVRRHRIDRPRTIGEEP